MWKDAQLRADEAMRQCMKEADEHIKRLLKENSCLAGEFNRLYGDYCIVEGEMRRIKNAINMRLPSGSDPPDVIQRGQKMHAEVSDVYTVAPTTTTTTNNTTYPTSSAPYSSLHHQEQLPIYSSDSTLFTS